MGAWTSRQNAGVEEVDVVSNHVYKYPPRTGNYFGSHFIMGGERFDTPQPESYLFGENSDLNFLGSRPLAFPYPPPKVNEPTKTLKSLVNIRKESLRFVRVANVNRLERDAELGNSAQYNIEFIFDCDVQCAITIYYFCTEDITPNGVQYVSRDPSLTSRTFHYKRGANQHFSQPSHIFYPSQYSDEDLLYDVDREMIPIAIHCVVAEGADELSQSHTTIATVEKVTEEVYLLKSLKQKLFVDGLCYLLQEIYGIENKNNDKAGGDDDTDDNGSECVICMCDVRDTLILPCRHLCLCNSCADSLRYQANNCPICRAPFRALLQIRALQSTGNANIAQFNPPDGSCDTIPPGYEAVSLIEALNGPSSPRQPPSAVPDLIETPDNENAIQAALLLNRQCDSSTPSKCRTLDPEYGASASGMRGDEHKETSTRPLLSEQKISISPRNKNRCRDTVKHINEKLDKDENLDEDSEAEKLSPLLLSNSDSSNHTSTLPLDIVGVVDSIDDADTDHEDQSCIPAPDKPKINRNGEERGDESDYYTPEEPAPVTGPLYEGVNASSLDSTPQRLPGTPMSHASVRSSGDSYTSGSSTRHLLAVVTNNGSIDDRSVNV